MYCSRGCGRPMVSTAGTCGDAYCAASLGILRFPPASSPAHDPLTCPCCQLAAERVREAEAESRAAHERLGDALTDYRDAHEERKRLRALLTECADLIDSACPDASVWTDGLADRVDEVLR